MHSTSRRRTSASAGFRGGAFRGVIVYLDDMAKKAVVENLRYEFVRLMTVDGPTNDRRRREYNQALFDPETGRANWTSIDLDMVTEKFDKAVKKVLP